MGGFSTYNIQHTQGRNQINRGKCSRVEKDSTWHGRSANSISVHKDRVFLLLWYFNRNWRWISKHTKKTSWRGFEMYHQFIAAAAAVQQLKRVFNDDDDCRGKKSKSRIIHSSFRWWWWSRLLPLFCFPRDLNPKQSWLPFFNFNFYIVDIWTVRWIIQELSCSSRLAQIRQISSMRETFFLFNCCW